MFKKLAYTVNDIPFAGKLTLRPLAYHYWNATSVVGKTFWFTWLVAILILFIAGHLSQSLSGFRNVDFSQSIILNAVFLAYALINFLVAIAQFHLLIRAVKLIPRKPLSRKREYHPMGCGATILCVLVTLLGQITFLVASGSVHK